MNSLDGYIDKVICGDSLEVCPDIPAKSINLVVNDPPYNIGKAEWDKIPDYINWCGGWIAEAERVLMDNGSFYLFHNDFMAMMKLVFMIGEQTEFIFKQQIVWNKRFEDAHNRSFLDIRTHTEALRNYSKMAEYILFYTFQDETGLSRIYNDRDCFRQLKEYFWRENQRSSLTNKQINELLGTATNGSGMAGHYFKLDLEQWLLPTAEMYAKLQTTGYFQREYEDLRREYEDLRYTFNNQKTHHSVWNYETVKNPTHPTQKPVDLIENIILHSSNPGDVVLDMFAGSCTTAAACIRTGRHYICIEKEQEYCDIGEKRIEAVKRGLAFERNQLDMFAEAAGD